MLFPPSSSIMSEECVWQISELPRKPSFELKICHRWQNCSGAYPERRLLGMRQEEEGRPRQEATEAGLNSAGLFSHNSHPQAACGEGVH